MKDEEWEVLDRKELETIRMCLALSMALIISNEKTMSTFADLSEKPSASNKVFLMKHLFNMKMS